MLDIDDNIDFGDSTELEKCIFVHEFIGNVPANIFLYYLSKFSENRWCNAKNYR